jgi:hypothetical protein
MMGTKKEELALVPVQLFDNSAVLSTPAPQLDDDELIMVWSMLDIMEKSLVKERKGELRDEMLKRAERDGKKDEKGSFVWALEDGKITKQKRQGSGKVEPALVMAKLGSNPVVAKSCLRETITLSFSDYALLKEILKGEDEELRDHVENSATSVDVKAFEGLIAAGLVTPEEADSVTSDGSVTWALTVSKPKSLKPLQDTLKAAMKRKKELSDD